MFTYTSYMLQGILGAIGGYFFLDFFNKRFNKEKPSFIKTVSINLDAFLMSMGILLGILVIGNGIFMPIPI